MSFVKIWVFLLCLCIRVQVTRTYITLYRELVGVTPPLYVPRGKETDVVCYLRVKKKKNPYRYGYKTRFYIRTYLIMYVGINKSEHKKKKNKTLKFIERINGQPTDSQPVSVYSVLRF